MVFFLDKLQNKNVVFLIIFLISCSEKSGDSVGVLEINPSKKVVNFDANGGYQSFTVSGVLNFQVNSDQSEWCTVTVFDYLTDNLRVSVSRNESFEMRKATVTISAENDQRIDLVICQKGIEPVLSVNKNKVLVQIGKPEFALDITANIPFVFDLPEWITEKGDNSWFKGLKTYTFSLSDLPDGVSFRKGTVVIRPESNIAADIQPITVDVMQKAVPKIIAHRGFWNLPGSAQNSLSSLKNAIELEVYGSELDVWITLDDVVVVNHDPTYQGVSMEHSFYVDLINLRLSNGEPIPTLQQCIELIRKQDKTRLIIEIKAHSTVEKENRAVAAVVKLVEEAGIGELVDYISFSENICNKLFKNNPKHRVYYLNGNKTPEELKTAGFYGLDYSMSVLRAHPDWVSRAYEMGIKTNVWTVNQPEDMLYFIQLGVDFITTDDPLRLKSLLTN